MESKVCKLSWLYSKIFEGLCSRINDLVNELALNLVFCDHRPPKRLVHYLGNGL